MGKNQTCGDGCDGWEHDPLCPAASTDSIICKNCKVAGTESRTVPLSNSFPMKSGMATRRQVRVTQHGKVTGYVLHAETVLFGGEKTVIIKGMGRAIGRAVTVAETVKRKVKGLHQTTDLSTVTLVNRNTPQDEEARKRAQQPSSVSFITITLSESPLDTTHIGYQPPLSLEETATDCHCTLREGNASSLEEEQQSAGSFEDQLKGDAGPAVRDAQTSLGIVQAQASVLPQQVYPAQEVGIVQPGYPLMAFPEQQSFHMRQAYARPAQPLQALPMQGHHVRSQSMHDCPLQQGYLANPGFSVQAWALPVVQGSPTQTQGHSPQGYSAQQQQQQQRLQQPIFPNQQGNIAQGYPMQGYVLPWQSSMPIQAFPSHGYAHQQVQGVGGEPPGAASNLGFPPGEGVVGQGQVFQAQGFQDQLAQGFPITGMPVFGTPVQPSPIQGITTHNFGGSMDGLPMQGLLVSQAYPALEWGTATSQVYAPHMGF
ncbi:unnamed protein product, partial [Discosporangium mesarthrocarpum]